MVISRNRINSITFNSNPTFSENALQDIVTAHLLNQPQRFSPKRFVVAFSGGLDSTVLLYSLKQIAHTHSIPLKAIHINHQLNSAADEWQAMCQVFCEKQNISFESIKVCVAEDGKSPEDAARQARYGAIKSGLIKNDILFMGHHKDDQIETFFLRLLRGAGIDGITSMKILSPFHNSYLFRPLLFFTRKSLFAYAESQSLSWIEDDSNTDERYDRNYLRHQVLPVIAKRWPAYINTINRFIEHATDASNLIKKISEDDLKVCLNKENDTLDIKKLKNYSLLRQNNLIRMWLNEKVKYPLSLKQLTEIQNVIFAKVDAEPKFQMGAKSICRYRNELHWVANIDNEMPGAMSLENFDLSKVINLPDNATIVFRKNSNVGIGLSHLQDAKIEIRFRQVGDKCRPQSRGQRHSLKKIFQEIGIPPWERDSIPLLTINGEVAALIGYFYCEPFIDDVHNEFVEFVLKRE